MVMDMSAAMQNPRTLLLIVGNEPVNSVDDGVLPCSIFFHLHYKFDLSTYNMVLLFNLLSSSLI
jgi:hypothetical protein